MAERKKIVFICTHGPDKPELAALPFAVAMVAQAAEMEPVMGFHDQGALLLQPGVAERVFAHGYPSLKRLLDAYVQDGGRLLVCRPGAGDGASAEPLITGVEIVNDAVLARECREAASVAIY